jgi:dihydroorotate dehydrogenase
LAAGYDKHAEAIDGMLGLGFGLVECGSVTPLPQKGNPKPRFFRLPEDEAVINRYGFNSEGHNTVLFRLKKRLSKFLDNNNAELVEGKLPVPFSLVQGRLLGVNLGKNKYSPADCHDDYLKGIEKLGPYSDYIVINISSPNTPGLRALQRREPIEQLLSMAKRVRDEKIKNQIPLLVKIAPDCSDDELEDIAAVVKNVGVDGIIIGNTTISRPESLKTGNSNSLSRCRSCEANWRSFGKTIEAIGFGCGIQVLQINQRRGSHYRLWWHC